MSDWHPTYRNPVPPITRPDTSPSGDFYASRADMTRDMADPRYASDPAFRHVVAMKLAATHAARGRR